MIEELLKSPFLVSFEISFVFKKSIVLGLGHVRELVESGVDTVGEKAGLHGNEQLTLTVIFFSSRVKILTDCHAHLHVFFTKFLISLPYFSLSFLNRTAEYI